MPALTRTLIALMPCLLVAAISSRPARAEDWQAVAAEDLQMSSEPKAPGAPAVYLYRQVDRDDNGPDEIDYVRIKILADEGRKYANVEIPFLKESETVDRIQARTIRPNGTIVNFDGTIYEKTIVKARDVKYLAKTFTLPDAQIGSIIEYRYHHSFAAGYVFDSHWILSAELFTKHARFSLVPYAGFLLRWSWPMGLPDGTAPPENEHGRIRLDTRDVPAFVTEESMPPEIELKTRVDFIYDSDEITERDPTAYWARFGKKRFRTVDAFVDKRHAMEQALAQIIQPGDAPEEKLRKIYARTQQIRNLTFERDKTAQELKREKLKERRNAADVWEYGYGTGEQITWLFLALVRAAGFQADPVYISTRNDFFFEVGVMNPGKLNTNVVLVKLNGADLYLDPGMVYAPFGVLPWSETAVQGRRLDKDGGSWIVTPLSKPEDSRIERKATLTLTDTGDLAGKVTVTYSGLEALWRRAAERGEDDTARQRFLEEQMKEYVPVGINVRLTNRPDWDSAASTLVAEFDLEVPGWATAAGHRALLAVGLFGGKEKHVLDHAVRVHPLYFEFPCEQKDDVTIALPERWHVGSVPEVRAANVKLATYHVGIESTPASLHLTRELMVNLILVAVKYYPSMRDFYQTVRSGDDQQIVVLAEPAQARH